MINKNFKNNIIWNSVGLTTYLICTWLLTIVIVRVSGYEDAGILSLGLALSNVFVMIALFGVRTYQVSDVKDKISNDSYIWLHIFTLGFSLMLCIVFTSLNNYDFEIKFIVFFIIFFKLSEALIDVFHGILQKKWRMDIIGKSYIVRGLLTIIVFTCTMMLLQSLLLTSVILSICLYGFIFLYDIPKCNGIDKINLKYNPIEVKKIFADCFPLLVYSLAFVLSGTIPKYFLKQICGYTQLGIYTSITTPILILQVMVLHVFTPMVGLFAEYFENNDFKTFKMLFVRVLITILIITIVALSGSRLFGKLGLKILFGENILAYYYLFFPAIVCSILTSIIWFLFMVLTVTKNKKGLVLSNLVSLVACLIVTPIAIRRYGMQGVNIVTIIYLTLNIVFLLYFLLKDFKILYHKWIDQNYR